MRIDLNKNVPNMGDEKVIRRFLFLPLTIDNTMRWLEMATYRVNVTALYTVGGGSKLYVRWSPVEWVD